MPMTTTTSKRTFAYFSCRKLAVLNAWVSSGRLCQIKKVGLDFKWLR